MIEYLATKPNPIYSGGASWCRFHCPGFSHWGLGIATYTDGAYSWPEGLVHYIKEHAVRPPREFVEHALAGGSPDYVEDRSRMLEVDWAWWLEQEGTGSSIPTHLARERRGNLKVAWLDDEPGLEVVRLLRRYPAFCDLSVPEVRHRLASGKKLLLLKDQYATMLRDEVRELSRVGLWVSFELEVPSPRSRPR